MTNTNSTDQTRTITTSAGEVHAYVENDGHRRTIAIDQTHDEHTPTQARELAAAVLEAAAWLESR